MAWCRLALRKCVFQKEFLIYAKWRELIERCCMKIIQTCQSFFPVFIFYFFFQITFDLLLTSRLNTLKYTDQPIWFDFYWWSRAKQTTNSNMVWYLNMNTSTYSHWSNDVGENLPLAMHFVGGEGCYLWVLFLRDSMLMFIYHRHIFLYIIHQNNPVSKSLRKMIPWFLRNRSYRRRAPSYRRHPIKLPSSVIWDKFAYRRLAANLSGIIVQKREKVRVCRFGTRWTTPPCFSVVNLREIGGREEARAGKNFSKRAAASAPSWRR